MENSRPWKGNSSGAKYNKKKPYYGERELQEFDKARGSNWEGHYIGDPVIFKAVTFALNIYREGKSMADALGISANYYKIKVSDIAVELMTDTLIKQYDGDKLNSSIPDNDIFGDRK